jgi:hypothetical protein
MGRRSGQKGEICFKSAKELRQILDSVLKEIDGDPEDGPRLRAAAGPLRLEFPDLNLALNIRQADRGRHALRWDFAKRAPEQPTLRLSMESEFANRLLPGRENPAIAIARGRLRTTVVGAGAALRFFPASKPLISHYRQLVTEKYPHLVIE